VGVVDRDRGDRSGTVEDLATGREIEQLEGEDVGRAGE
jgi:hypothetical protein